MRRFCTGYMVVFSALFLWAGFASARTYHFETPPASLAAPSQELFSRAIGLQKKGLTGQAIKLWREFLENNPRSHEARNNLGLAYFMEDRLADSVREFEMALEIAPEVEMVRENLKRALKFQVTLFKRNKDLDAAIGGLKRLHQLSPPRMQEKIEFEIEKLDDRIFEEVQRANTAEAYQNYLKNYPDSLNAKEARAYLARMKTGGSVPQSEENPEEGKPPDRLAPTRAVGDHFSLPREAELWKEEAHVEELPFEGGPLPETPESRTIEIVALPDGDSGDLLQPVAPSPSGKETSPEVPAKVSAEEPADASPGSKPLKDPVVLPDAPVSLERVEVVTDGISLNVRSAPSTQAEVVSRAAKGSRLPLLRDRNGWFMVEYAKDKAGWVSKKYVRKVE